MPHANLQHNHQSLLKVVSHMRVIVIFYFISMAIMWRSRKIMRRHRGRSPWRSLDTLKIDWCMAYQTPHRQGKGSEMAHLQLQISPVGDAVSLKSRTYAAHLTDDLFFHVRAIRQRVLFEQAIFGQGTIEQNWRVAQVAITKRSSLR
jgi:hypothetical protein